MQMSTRNILVSLHNGSAAERRQLAGILRYAVNAGNWNFDFRPGITPKQSAEYDGIISGTGLKDWMHNDLPVPPTAQLVLIGADNAIGRDAGPARVGYVLYDDFRAGQQGAQHLLSLGRMRSYGFVPCKEPDREWSMLRQRGMEDALGRQGLSLAVFDASSCTLDGWLSSIPKPAAVMAASDEGANQVISICRNTKIRIPDRLVVIGNDNDELMCESLRPRLSSVCIDHEGAGFAAAKMLDRMMRYPNRPVKDVLIAPRGVVVRESTRPVSPAANLIERALAYIREHASDGITVDDVVDHVNVSRCLLYLRFREQLGKSILAAITERRVAMMKTKLKSSKAPVAQLALACGFPTAGHATRVFKAATGVSPHDWRTKACSIDFNCDF